ncbi:glycosyltransferase family 39 protein [Mangrovibacterium lignilyticum]|uniref:glycosyltransferase family 39 protein n=1 Tax=Mangrovibacterium lignilyticum TaxID=2668052 RepID=UPI0013CFBDC9|nr:glycosyltransferase family 39 protein [Mangrovibacterium lignilyticum]
MSQLNQLFRSPYLFLVIVLIGVSLKFYKINQQFFWDDEVCTVLHTSGVPMSQYEKEIPVNQILHKKYFDDLLKLNDRGLKISDQFVGLMEMPQVTPGHYYYFIFLTRIFGDDYRVFRYFSLVAFLLSVPILFFLTKKIFNSGLAGWIAISFYTVSPFFQEYAQEARYYTLWAFAVILMHYLFLMALEKQAVKWWMLYVFFGFFAIHTTILVFITLLAHFIYGLIYYRALWKKIVLSQFIIFLTSVPWLIFIFINREDIIQSLAWQKIGSWSDLSVFDLLLIHINHTIDSFTYFFNLGVGEFWQTAGRWFYGILMGLAVIVFFRRAEAKPKLFVGLIAFLGVAVLIAMDLIRSSGSSDLSRYLLFNFIGFYVLVSFSLKRALVKWPMVFGCVFLIVIALGITSSLKEANDVADGKRADAYYHVKDAAERFSGNEHILIISDFKVVSPHWYTAFLSLMRISKNENIDVIYAKPEYPDFKKDFDLKSYDTVYAMYLSDSLLNDLKTNFNAHELTEVEKRVMYNYFDVSVYQIQRP